MRNYIMNPYAIRLLLLCKLSLGALFLTTLAIAATEQPDHEAEPERGPHQGRMLRDGDFAVELTIFETGVPPEFRIWVTDDDQPVAPEEVDLGIQLTRLGGVVDDIQFRAEDDYLRGDTVVYEPHSFIVSVTATYEGNTYSWEYDNFEGRTRIADNVAEAMGIATETAGSATLHQTIRVYGKLLLPPEARQNIQARFDGEIQEMQVSLGDEVSQGQVLATIESNESLQTYQIVASMDGIV
ncbi:MAG: efflux RND transporter periplasmic adaptor subunit, partial [Pseudomonadales bacterium]